jgi:hypothetical protein
LIATVALLTGTVFLPPVQCHCISHDHWRLMSGSPTAPGSGNQIGWLATASADLNQGAIAVTYNAASFRA